MEPRRADLESHAAGNPRCVACGCGGGLRERRRGDPRGERGDPQQKATDGEVAPAVAASSAEVESLEDAALEDAAEETQQLAAKLAAAERRACAAEAMAATALEWALQSGDAEVRRGAADAVGKFAADVAIPAHIIEALALALKEDRSEVARRSAASAIAEVAEKTEISEDIVKALGTFGGHFWRDSTVVLSRPFLKIETHELLFSAH